ncbi:MAG: ParB/RepB/Spo0J family partition protein, partial [Anaerotignum sp.]|nr:ParB/RepB/Spo0J family partition protein [Anaerotignum sp.]
MRESTAKNIKFESIADLFGTPREFDENTISMVPLKNLYAFANHPYRVMDDEKMMELVESVKENGVLEPAIVRLRALGGYEIISGHRRKRACELAGMDEMPVFVKNLSDDDAAIMMVDANNQREEL